MATQYDSKALAEGYATARPPLHQEILARTRPHLELLGIPLPVRRALDVGCGAGLSTRALQALARECVGVDPSPAMVTCAASMVPEARFQLAHAEALPLASASIDLIAAAGSLNYTDLDRFFPEAVRILVPGGALVVYDFGQGRTCRESAELEAWFTGFQERYPAPSDGWRELSPQMLAHRHPRLPLVASEPFKIGVPFALDGYVNYLLTESNLAPAIARGATTSELREMLTRELQALFGQQRLEVLFPGYFAVLRSLP